MSCGSVLAGLLRLRNHFCVARCNYNLGVGMWCVRSNARLPALPIPAFVSITISTGFCNWISMSAGMLTDPIPDAC